MKDITINIPDMQSAHCQTRVNNAVKDIEGVEIKHLETQKITVSLSSDEKKDEVVKAIENAGYTVSA